MLKLFRKIRHFFEVDLWRMKLRALPKGKRIFFTQLRIWIISIRGFIIDKCVEKASALTYFSVLSIVPVVAVLFAIAKGFGLEKLLEREMRTYLSGQQEVLNYVLPYAQNMLNGANGGFITGISLVFLLYAVIRLLSNIEIALNDIWGVKKSRTIERKISDYLAIMLLGPILLIMSSSVTVFITSQITNLAENMSFLSQLKSGIVFLLKFAPYVLIWILFTLIYLIFPNTKVKIVPAIITGILAGTLYQLTQWGFINFQFAFSRYNAIYGTLALLPLLLIWLQISWLIVLFGAEFCYAVQHRHKLEFDSEKLKLSISHKRKLALLLLHRIVKKFEKGEGIMFFDDLSISVNFPRKYVIDICNELEKANLITQVENEDIGYLPAFDINQMDLHTVISKYETEGMGEFDGKRSKTFDSINKSMKGIQSSWKSLPINKLIKDL